MTVNAPLKLTLSAAPYPAAPVLVMISGLGGTGGYWQPQSPLGSHFQLVSYDQRGTGNNPDTLPDHYTMADMAAELHQALTAAGICHYGVLGHALGGLMGLQLALDYPEAISALVVVNGWLTLTAQTRRCFRLRELLLQAGGPEAWIDAQPLFLYPPAWMAAHEARLEAEACLQASHFQGEANLLRRLTALKNADYQHLAPRIQQPVLAIASRDDLLVPWDATMALQQALPYCQADILDQGGHACNVTAAPKFNAIIHPWLIRHMAARPPIDRELS